MLNLPISFLFPSNITIHHLHHNIIITPEPRPIHLIVGLGHVIKPYINNNITKY